MIRHANVRAMSLVGVVVGLALASGLALIVGKLVADGMRGGKSAEMKQEVATLMSMVRDGLDCQQTLGITPATPLPMACPAGPIVLRKKATVASGPVGPELAPGGKVGEWTLTATCVNSEIIVGVRRPGMDPVSKRAWNDLPIATDLFRGASDFCGSYLGAAPAPCPHGTRTLAIDGTAHCVSVQNSCAIFGYSYDAATGRCAHVVSFGGTYELGPTCETPNTWNPGYGCNCPPGFYDTMISHTYEGGGDFDEPHLCVKW